jgi:aspartate oxidase
VPADSCEVPRRNAAATRSQYARDDEFACRRDPQWRIEQTTGNFALRNMATTALIVATSAWARCESRGAHFRADYPAEDTAQRRRTMTTLNEARHIAASLDHTPLKRTSAGA